MNINKELLKDIGLGFTDSVLAVSPGFLVGIIIDSYAKKYNIFGKHAKYIVPFVTAALVTPIMYLSNKRIDSLENSEIGVKILQDVCKEYEKEFGELQGEEA